MSRYFDREGRPIGVLAWSRLLRDGVYKRVARTEVGDVAVSTVWLGLDYNWHPAGPPHIFETMIFGGPFDGFQWRYSSLEAAEKSHERIAAELLAGRDPP